MLSGNSLRQTVHTYHASFHQAAKLVAALLRVARVTAGMVESNGSLPPSLWLTSPAGWLPRTGISSGTLRSVIEYGLPLSVVVYLTCASVVFRLHVSVCSYASVAVSVRHFPRQAGRWSVPWALPLRSRSHGRVHSRQAQSHPLRQENRQFPGGA